MPRPPAWFLLAPFALAYFFSYGLRTINAAIAPYLVSELGLSQATLGLLTAAYFLSFALAQLPVGIAIDRYGPRRVNASLLLVGVVGCLWFAFARSEISLLAARSLIGLGVAGCLMTAIKSNAQWFGVVRLPGMNAWVHVCGLGGAVASTVPVAMLVSRWGMSAAFVLAAGIGLCASLWLWWFSPDAPHTASRETLRENLAGTLGIFRDRRFWNLATVASIAMGLHMAMQGLWVGQWLRQVRGLDEIATGSALFAMMLAGAIGALGWGLLAARLGRMGISTLQVYASACLLHIASLLFLALNLPLPAPMLTAFYALTGMGASLCYATLTARFDLALAGRVNTALNVLVMSIAFAAQAGIGYVLQALQQGLGWSIQTSFAALLWGMLLSIGASLAWAWRARE